MRIKVYKNDELLNFENSLLIENFVILNENLSNKNLPEFDFSSLHFLLNESNKYLLGMSFLNQLNESINGR